MTTMSMFQKRVKKQEKRQENLEKLLINKNVVTISDIEAVKSGK